MANTQRRYAQQEIAGLAFRAIVAEGLASLRAGKMDDDDLHLSWQVVSLDAQGRRELADCQLESLKRTEDIRVASEARLRKSGGEGTPTVTGAFGFPRSRRGRSTAAETALSPARAERGETTLAPAGPSSGRPRAAAPSGARRARGGPLQTIAWPLLWIWSAMRWPWSRLTPGSTLARVAATCSKVLWLSLRTITRHSPPRPEPGPEVRGRSSVPVAIARHYASHQPAAGQPLPLPPGIDALRALAVLAVFFYHSAVGWMPGGFLGVDVFFVISGYLITSLLLREFRRGGHVRLGRFWLRRARRLLPAVGVLIAVTMIAAAIVEPDRIDQLRGDAMAWLAYVANWHFILDAPVLLRPVPARPLSSPTSGRSRWRSSSTSSGRWSSRLG